VVTVRRMLRDDGFTLTELIAVMGLLGVILAIAYGGFSVAAKGSDMSDRQAQMSREIGAPLLFADRVITQAFDFDTSYPGISPNRFAFYCDQNGNGYRERYVIEVAGTRLLVTSEEENGRARKTSTWSESNANLASGTPLFRYFRSDGTEIATMGDVAQNVRSVQVTIVVDTGGSTISDSRMMFLRNR
jgi:prepilin-type N-terminal cleavage/methylation domain-containing protein